MSDTNAQISTLIHQAKLQLKVDDTAIKPDLVHNIDASTLCKKQTTDDKVKTTNEVLVINFDKLVYDALFK